MKDFKNKGKMKNGKITKLAIIHTNRAPPDLSYKGYEPTVFNMRILSSLQQNIT